MPGPTGFCLLRPLSGDLSSGTRFPNPLALLRALCSLQGWRVTRGRTGRGGGKLSPGSSCWWGGEQQRPPPPPPPPPGPPAPPAPPPRRRRRGRPGEERGGGGGRPPPPPPGGGGGGGRPPPPPPRPRELRAMRSEAEQEERRGDAVRPRPRRCAFSKV